MVFISICFMFSVFFCLLRIFTASLVIILIFGLKIGQPFLQIFLLHVCCGLVVRYVDMIANPEVADVFRKRAKVGHHPNFICLRKSFLLVLFLIFFYNLL
jgi:hypothetical protein